MNRFYYIGIVLFLLIPNACQKEEGYQPPDLPDLVDDIPFSDLGEGVLVFHRIGPYPDGGSGYYVIDVENRKTWPIKISSLSGYPSVSPDGRKIAFSMFRPFPSKSHWDIHIMDITGENIMAVTDFEIAELYPSWTPNGGQLLYKNNSYNRPSGDELYIQSSVENPKDRILIRSFFVLSSPASVSRSDKITVAGRVLDEQNSTGIFIMDLDGKNLQLLVPRPQNFELNSPVFAPNGENIAFLSVLKDQGEYKSIDIKIIDVGSKNAQTLTTVEAAGAAEWSIARDLSLCWSPDGQKLLFTLPEGDFISHIYMIKLDGSDLTKVTTAEGVSDRYISWSR